MLQHVGDAHFGGQFVPAARPDPDAKGGAFQIGHLIRDDRQAIGKIGYFYVHIPSLEEMNWRIKESLLGKTSSFSGKPKSRSSRSGRTGGVPVALVTASANLAGWAVESTTTGSSGKPSLREAEIATAVCGSTILFCMPATALMVASVSSSSLDLAS